MYNLIRFLLFDKKTRLFSTGISYAIIVVTMTYISRPKTNKVDVISKQCVLSKHMFDTTYVICTYLGITFD